MLYILNPLIQYCNKNIVLEKKIRGRGRLLVYVEVHPGFVRADKFTYMHGHNHPALNKHVYWLVKFPINISKLSTDICGKNEI